MARALRSAYRLAAGSALATALGLMWVIGAVGLVGAEGDPYDFAYGSVLAVGIVGSAVARFRPRGMARALVAAALVQALVAVVALIVGKQHSPVSSVTEILGANGFFVGLWLASARLFVRAARVREAATAGRSRRCPGCGRRAPETLRTKPSSAVR